MTVEHQRSLPGILLASPPSLPSESRASWIQRVCGAHQYSLRQLCAVSGVRPIGADWDRPIPPDKWSSFLDMACADEGVCAGAVRGLGRLLTAMSTSTRELLLYEGKNPRYRWCPQCWSHDMTPYLRWSWRVREATHCAVHLTPLKNRCPWCQMSLCVHRALLVTGGRASGVPDLATCGYCELPLSDRDTLAPSKYDDAINSRRKLSGQRAAGRREPSIAESQTLQYKFDQVLIDVFGSKQAVEIDLRVLRKPNASARASRKQSSADQSGGSPANLEVGRRTWSRSLRPSDRTRLAKALWTIRAEKRAMHLEATSPTSTAERPSEGGESR
ncbi:TniQ family protein [Variovorax sp. Root318D1]|uniref:TniQ family protein n=1 Tax=Variovorax sp. Root318D1 TaxID=1736513 RepID=UPI0009EB4A45